MIDKLKRVEPSGGFRAIGILGADIHDKLLLLQALHKRFPYTIFFTTDLDATLFHPKQWSWTRSLVIASHFDLELTEKLQGSIPPFRDSYQTSVFYATLRALGYLVEDPQDDTVLRLRTSTQDRFSRQAKPKVYEVSRNGVVDLSDESSHLVTPLNPARPSPPSLSTVAWGIALLVGAIVAVLVLLCPISQHAQRFVMHTSRWAQDNPFLTTGGCLGTLLILSVGGMWLISDGSQGEPFSLFEGVSIWPTEAIRFLAALFCVGCFLKARHDVRENNSTLSKEFVLAEPTHDGSLRWWSRDSSFSIAQWEKPTGKVQVHRLWEEYLTRGLWRYRLRRIFPHVLSFLVFGQVVMFLFGFPHRPYRGPVSLYADIGVLVFSVLSFIVLTFTVVDATRLCRSFIRRLTKDSTQWPDPLLQDTARAHQMPPELLADFLDIQLIAQRTEVIGKFIYYPFIALFLMIVARHSYFDNWDLPIGLGMIFVLSSTYAAVSAIMLRRAAESARNNAIKRLQTKLIGLKGEGKEAQADQVKLLMEEIQSISEGAFRPLTAHPVFRAVALPSGGYGFLLFFEYLSTIP